MDLIDVKTVAIVGMMLYAALAIVMGYTELTRKVYPGFHYWTLGLVCWVVASISFFFRKEIGDDVSILLANPLYLLFCLLIRQGMVRFYGYDKDRLWLTVSICVACLCLAVTYWFRYSVDDINMRIIGNSLGMGVILMIAGLEPIVNRVKRYPVQSIVSGCLILSASGLLARGVSAAVNPVYLDMFRQDILLKVVLMYTNFTMVIIVYGFISLVHCRLEEELVASRMEVQQLANTDLLTGLANRRGFMDIAEHDIRVARRYSQPLSLIFFDLDLFKRINDSHGHAVGDEVLAAIGRICREEMRDVDTSARWGGEEFIVLMPQTDAESARLAAERLRERIKKLSLETVDDLNLTASFGVAQLGNGDVHDLIARADNRLYQAKSDGRDRVCVDA